MELIARARAFAAERHATHKRKYTGDPYTVHTTAVADMLAELGFRDEVVAAAHLHDVVEDFEYTNTTIGEVELLFGTKVAELVLEVTDVSKRSDGNRAVRRAIDRAHLAKASAEGQSIKLADLIDNTASIVEYDPNFAKVYLAEKRALLTVLHKGHRKLFIRASELANRVVT